MAWRPKTKEFGDVRVRKKGDTKPLAKSGRQGNGPVLKIILNHGDIMVMHGSAVQKFYEVVLLNFHTTVHRLTHSQHEVVPLGNLRFAVTARRVNITLMQPEDQAAAKKAGTIPIHRQLPLYNGDVSDDDEEVASLQDASSAYAQDSDHDEAEYPTDAQELEHNDTESSARPQPFDQEAAGYGPFNDSQSLNQDAPFENYAHSALLNSQFDDYPHQADELPSREEYNFDSILEQVNSGEVSHALALRAAMELVSDLQNNYA